MTAIAKALSEYGDTAIAVADLLYGDSYEIAKSIEEKQKNNELLQTKLSQASNIIGLGAGIAAAPPVYREARSAVQDYKRNKGLPPVQGPKERFKLSRVPKRFKSLPKGTKAAVAVAGGNAALQGLNIGGDALTNVVLRRTEKMQKEKVAKNLSLIHI